MLSIALLVQRSNSDDPKPKKEKKNYSDLVPLPPSQDYKQVYFFFFFFFFFIQKQASLLQKQKKWHK